MTFAQVPPSSSPEQTIPLWPDQKMPGKGADQPEKDEVDPKDKIRKISSVSKPTLALFKAPNAKEPAAAVIICPGGGYYILAYDLEGNEIATWLNSIGITAIVLKYRVPKNRDGAFQDVQRAIRLTRSKALEWGIDPNRLGVLGFSAGGHLAARLSSNFREPAYPAIDPVDDLSCRPDFTVLVYPAYLGENGTTVPELKLDEKIPPTLIIHTEDDVDLVPGSKIYHAALDDKKISNRFLLYPDGGHGYGLHSDKAVAVWPKDAEKWLKEIGIP